MEKPEIKGKPKYMVADGKGGFREATKEEILTLEQPLDIQVLGFEPNIEGKGVNADRGGIK